MTKENDLINRLQQNVKVGTNSCINSHSTKLGPNSNKSIDELKKELIKADKEMVEKLKKNPIDIVELEERLYENTLMKKDKKKFDSKRLEEIKDLVEKAKKVMPKLKKGMTKEELKTTLERSKQLIDFLENNDLNYDSLYLNEEKNEEDLNEICNHPSKYEMVNHPNHYNEYDIEVIDMMERIWGVEATILFCQMNAFKYRQRMGLKPGQPIEQDLNKEKWYLKKAKELKSKL